AGVGSATNRNGRTDIPVCLRFRKEFRKENPMSSTLQSAAFAPGRFGPYGGRYVPETLMVPLFELERAYEAAKSDPKFQSDLADLLKNFAGRPTPLQFAKRLTSHLGGP